MRRNRRRKTFHFKAVNVGVAIMLVAIAGPWVANCLLGVSNDQVGAQIRLLEQEVRTHQESLRREVARWNTLTEPERLDKAIAESGLRLSYAPPERTVTMTGDGRARMPESLRLRLAQERRARAGEAVARNLR
ncbi:MAG TPA: hypothetical protein IAC79_05185 [Candidatus Spyradenecus faecavium]|uniref:Uncharacterized protein n=1 Tax=Candidatus Spyradenecus faecavium TaxID=2840947 RepID=A0A9D1NNY2_9BACT|nr:hypothetical protein [Candidatus Spyradenecus faecavium]